MSTENQDRIIDCPVCEAAWNISRFTQCDCGAQMIFAEPGEELESIPSSEPAKTWVKEKYNAWLKFTGLDKDSHPALVALNCVAFLMYDSVSAALPEPAKDYKKAWDDLNAALDGLWNTPGISNTKADHLIKRICEAQQSAYKSLLSGSAEPAKESQPTK